MPRVVPVKTGKRPTPAGSTMTGPTAFQDLCNSRAGLNWVTGGFWALGFVGRALQQLSILCQCMYIGIGCIMPKFHGLSIPAN